MNHRSPAKRHPAVLAVLMLTGCAAIPHQGPSYHQMDARSAGLTPAAPPPVSDAEWWTGFGDAGLDRIMAEALDGNPGLEVAAARLRAAQAAIGVQGAALAPQLAIDAQEDRQRLSGRYIIPPPYAGTSRWVGTAQADLSWSLDLAGRQKALVQAARDEAGGAALDLAAARITLAGAVAQAYANFARACLQADLARRFIVSREAELALAQTRRTNRIGSDIELSAARTLVAEAREALVRAQGEQALMVHALAALAGRGADRYASIAPPAAMVATLSVPDHLPADLLARRPDILAAQDRIEAADATRRAARADFFPNVDLRAFAGVSAIGLGALFTGDASSYGAGPALHLPIFQGGRLKAGYAQAVAGQDMAIARYNELVVGAVHEVADALSAIDTNAQALAQQQEVALALAETVRLDAIRQQNGLAGRLDLLDAQDRALAAAQALVDLQADGVVARIRLVVAMGGGFSAHTATKGS